MMVEVWWKVFLLGLIIAGVLKLLGNPTSFVVLFSASTILVLILFIVYMVVYNVYSGRKQSRQTEGSEELGEKGEQGND